MDLPYQHIVVAIGFALMGLAAFARPRTLVALMDLPAQTPTARNEIQAVYGGFGLAMAVVLIVPYWRPYWQGGIAFAVGLALAGMAAGRLVAALREWPGRWPTIFFAIEAVASGLLLSTV
ncbi:MAG TPA: DUF4345 family protein [Rhizomicrobium sp.]|nr:DUF4345 family protein [Rhizomicrobium sp.]